MKAYAYLRVSGLGQAHGHGFERQAQEVEAHCQQAGIELVATFFDRGVSGTTDETSRPAFIDMLTAILANGVRTVVVEGLDRLARTLQVQEQLISYLSAKGVTLINARTGEDVTQAMASDPMRKAMVQVQGVFAELDKALIVKKLRAAREKKRAATGRCEGRIRMTDKPEMLPVIEKIRQLRRVPRGCKKPSDAKIATLLNAEGLTTSIGKPWTGPNVTNVRRSQGIA